MHRYIPSLVLTLSSLQGVTHHGGVLLGGGGLDVLGHGQVNELVLGLSLDHPGALLPHHLNVFWDVNVNVQT